MSYDFEDSDDHSPPLIDSTFIPDGKDLEQIVTLMTLGAIFLTNKPGDKFTFEELFRQTCELGGDEIIIAEVDFRIVLRSFKFLKKIGSNYMMR